MKVKTVIISVVVSASLVAGVGYGAYYAIRGKATPVEVVPVANVNQYYGWGDEDGNTVYGTITSQVAADRKPESGLSGRRYLCTGRAEGKGRRSTLFL